MLVIFNFANYITLPCVQIVDVRVGQDVDNVPPWGSVEEVGEPLVSFVEWGGAHVGFALFLIYASFVGWCLFYVC